jgi:hypothetical protein
MSQQQQSIFVLTACDGADLAFEAENIEAAEVICSSAWFAQAVARYLSGRRNEAANGAIRGPRAATGSEALTYRRIDSEFAERRDGLLIARLRECEPDAPRRRA